MRIYIGLLDDDSSYCERLANYFNSHYGSTQVEISIFTEKEELLDFLNHRGRVDVLLTTPELLPDVSVVSSRVLVEKLKMLLFTLRILVCLWLIWICIERMS